MISLDVPINLTSKLPSESLLSRTQSTNFHLQNAFDYCYLRFSCLYHKPHRPNMIKVEMVFDFFYSDSFFLEQPFWGRKKIGPKHCMYFTKSLFPRNFLACRCGCEVNVRLKKYLDFVSDISYVIIGNEFDQRTLNHTTAKKMNQKSAVRQEFSRLKKVNIGFKKCHNS